MGTLLPLLVLGAVTTAAPPSTFRGSAAAEALATQGWVVVDEKSADVDGDGRPDAVVVEGQLEQGPAPETMRVSFWKQGKKGWELLSRSPSVAGNKVGLFRAGDVGCGDVKALVEAVEEGPDEIRRSLLVLGGSPPERRGVIKSNGPWRDGSLLAASFVQEPFGFTLAGGELVVREKPTLLELKTPAGAAATVLVGARERRFRCEGNSFVQRDDRYVDGLVRRGGPSGPAGDGQLATALSPARGVSLRFPVEAGTRMLRLVPGCASGEAAWKRAGEVRRVRIGAPLAPPIEVDLAAPVPSTDPRVLASGVLPLGGAPWAKQLVLLLREPLQAGELSIDVTEAGGRGGCLAEVVAD